MSKCRAIVFNGDDTYEEREFPIPEPVPGGAVLRVEAVGLCGSDLMQFHGHAHVPGGVSPVVPGHEIVGRIAALAPDADLGVAVGQRVGLGPSAPNPEKPIGFDLYGYTMHPDEPHGPWGGYAEYMGIRPGTQLVAGTDALPAAELRGLTPGGPSAVMDMTPGTTQPIVDAIAMARAAEVLNAGNFPTAALRGEVYTLDQLDEALAMLDRKLEGRDAVRINLVHP